MHRFLLLFVLVTARVALAQGAAPRDDSTQEPFSQEAPSQEQVPPAPEVPPPLVDAPEEPQPPAPAASAAGSDSPLALTRGARIHVRSRSAPAGTGELVGLTPDSLSLQIRAGQVVDFKLADVERVEVRKRAWSLGAIAGAGTGAVGGGLFFLLLCSYAASETGGGIVPCVALGTLLSSATGAGVGALMGLAVPRWSTLYRKQGEETPTLRLREPDEDVLSHWFSGDLPVGEAGLQLGYARDMGVAQPSDGIGGRLHVLVLIGPYIALGPEMAWYRGVGTMDLEFNGQKFREHHDLLQFGALARMGVNAGPIRGAVLGGVGNYSRGSDHAAVSVVGEIEGHPTESLPPLALEVRYHINLKRNVGSPSPNLLTAGLGTRLRW